MQILARKSILHVCKALFLARNYILHVFKRLFLPLFEEFLEEKKLVVDRILPIISVVGARTDNEVMLNLVFQQFLVEIVVYLKEEIIIAAVEEDGEVAIFQSADLVDSRMLVPNRLILAFCSQQQRHPPVIREGADVQPAAHAGHCAEHVFMPQGKPHRSVPTHAQACDGASRTVGTGRIVRVDVLNQFFGDKRFVAIGRIDGAVPIPTVVSVGADKNHPFAVGDFFQFGLDGYPRLGVPAMPVQKIDGRTGFGRFVRRNHNDRYVLFHPFAVDRQRVDHGSAYRTAREEQEGQEEGSQENVLFHRLPKFIMFAVVFKSRAFERAE